MAAAAAVAKQVAQVARTVETAGWEVPVAPRAASTRWSTGKTYRRRSMETRLSPKRILIDGNNFRVG